MISAERKRTRSGKWHAPRRISQLLWLDWEAAHPKKWISESVFLSPPVLWFCPLSHSKKDKGLEIPCWTLDRFFYKEGRWKEGLILEFSLAGAEWTGVPNMRRPNSRILEFSLASAEWTGVPNMCLLGYLQDPLKGGQWLFLFFFFFFFYLGLYQSHSHKQKAR